MDEVRPRARATLEVRRPQPDAPPPAAGSVAEQELVERFVAAYEASDVTALVALLSDDVYVAMPPIPHEYVGRKPVHAFLASALEGRCFSLVPTRANGQPAFGLYVRNPGGRRATGLVVLELAGDRIAALVRFETTVLAGFGLPEGLGRAQEGSPTSGRRPERLLDPHLGRRRPGGRGNQSLGS